MKDVKIINEEELKQLKPGTNLELVKIIDPTDRKPAVVGPDGKIEAGNASFNVSGAKDIGCDIFLAV